MAESTVKLYEACLGRLEKAGIDLEDPDALAEYLEGAYKPATRITYLAAAMWMREEEDEVKELMRAHLVANQGLVQRQYQKSALTSKQTENLIEWDALLGIRDELKSHLDQGRAAYKYLLLLLYTRMPPRRREYADCAIVERSKEGKGNRYCPTEGKFVFEDYKTHKSMGKVEVTVPDDVAEAIQQSLRNKPRKYLFEGGNGRPWSRNMLTQAMRHGFKGFVLGPSLIRKIVKSEWSARGYGQSKELAKAMGHSETTAEQYYNQTSRLSAKGNDMGIALPEYD